MPTLFLLLFTILPDAHIVEDRFDLVEVNHYYDSSGKKIFDQVIYYNWSTPRARFDVSGWRLLRSSWQIPRKNRDGYVAIWRDGDIIRRTRASNVRETHTGYDPEVLERDNLHREDRIGFSENVNLRSKK